MYFIRSRLNSGRIGVKMWPFSSKDNTDRRSRRVLFARHDGVHGVLRQLTPQQHRACRTGGSPTTLSAGMSKSTPSNGCRTFFMN